MPARDEADPRVHPLIIERWSPRAFDASAVPQADLETILEAATWAPSAFNAQPWRFVYAHRGSEHWDTFLSLLVEFNQSWAKDASVLLFAISKRTGGSDGKPSHSHSFDTGAAWAMLALQAAHMGYFTHGMTGVEFGKAAEALGIPDDYRLEAAIALGRKGDVSSLPEKLQEREAPSGRNPVADVAFAGLFPQG